MRGFLRMAVFAGIALFATSARAEDEVLRLSWTAPDGCPSSGDVQVAAMRGVDRASVKDLLEADAVVEKKELGHQPWTVHLRTRHRGATGERAIEASTCDAVAEATAVILGLALGGGPELEPPPAPPPPPPEAPPAPSPSDAPEQGHAFALGASAAGQLAVLPSVAGGGSLTLAWTPGRARIELDARLWPSQSQALASSDVGARFSMTMLGGRACWTLLRLEPLEVSPCLGADVSFLSATGFGADRNFVASAVWTSVAGGALARVSLTPWLALRSRLEAAVPVSRPTFVVQNEGAVHRPSVIGAAGSLGLEVLFL